MKHLLLSLSLMAGIFAGYGQIIPITPAPGARDPRVTALERQLFPNYGTCRKCGRPWNCCAEHAVNIGNHSFVFALCEECWAECSVSDRKYYYTLLWREWERQHCKPESLSYQRLMDSVATSK